MRIFITGCAGSGTTLLNRLFLAFEDTDVISREAPLRELVEAESDKKFIIRKRTFNQIFSGSYAMIEAGPTLLHQINMIQDNDIQIINMIRDGRDLMPRPNHEKYRYCPRWIDSIDQIKKYGHLISATIRYEDLVTDPDEIQRGLVERYGLKVLHKFSDYPKFMTFGDEAKNWIHKNRPISPDRIGKNNGAYKIECADMMHEFERALRYLNYT